MNPAVFRIENTLTSVEQIRQPQTALERAVFEASARVESLPACPLCSGRKNRIAFRDNSCVLRICAACDLFFVDPYPSVTQQHEQASSGAHSEIHLLDCARRYEGERLYYGRHLASILEECAGARSILDVGCGTGHLLEKLAGLSDAHRVGIELNPEAAQFAERVAGCEVFRVPLEEFRCERMFDAVTMVNVFSHIPSFDGMFRSLRALLAPRGKLVLRTTEMAANVSRWNQVHWGIPDDLHFLGLRTLDFICAKYGFTIARRVRVPFEDELFRVSRWQQMGRNALQNVVKKAVVRVPGALRGIRRIYTSCLGQRLFVSFIVLVPVQTCEVKPCK